MTRVVVTHSDSHPVLIDRFREGLSADYDVVPVELPPGRMTTPADEALTDAVADAAALLCRSGLVDADLLDAGDLRIVSVHGSGVEHVDVAAATDRGVVVDPQPRGGRARRRRVRCGRRRRCSPGLAGRPEPYRRRRVGQSRRDAG
jgi:D-3-phosphoglycerate dehydrogenase (EC 1.1.1.95)